MDRKKFYNKKIVLILSFILATSAIILGLFVYKTADQKEVIVDTTDKFLMALYSKNEMSMGPLCDSPYKFINNVTLADYLNPGVSEESLNSIKEKLLSAICQGNYKVSDDVLVSPFGNHGQVTVTIETVDLAASFKNAQEDGIITVLPLAYDLEKYSSRELMKSLNNIIDKATKKITTRAIFYLEKYSGKWRIVSSDPYAEMYSSLNGGLTDFCCQNGLAPL